jgi:Histidine kinase-, DNA gyrase B-, and HSP90-like ATPase
MDQTEGPIEVTEATDPEGLIGLIEQSETGRVVARTILKTDDRVLARVTDGIYRQPASSFRELISNAYDADATRVTISTDAPRFARITIEDDGSGMSPATLANLLWHIGGSAKRTHRGIELGITQRKDVSRSPGGRVLIGKIGIGLFSVAQLTHSFQIVTKVSGDAFRTVATVVLRQYSDEEQPDASGSFESGKVNVWREPATDVDRHGTSIILTSVRPQARDTLRSRDVWSAIEQAEATTDEDERHSIEPPRYHIGRVDKSGDHIADFRGEHAQMPWSEGDGPVTAFQHLVDSVWKEVERSNPNPKLDRIFDYYLRMLWHLSLAAPLPYVDGHPFDLPASGWADCFQLSNAARGGAVAIESKSTLRAACELTEPSATSQQEFRVIVDGVELLRPIRFRKLPTTSHALKKPIMFIGRCVERFDGIPRELSGGTLAFEAYLLWAPKIAPTDHQGSLIRIHGASGTLFDSTFMRYQVSEQTRLRQTVCEIFVHQGLDSALNIDRESFNNAHPHAVFITRWLHNALRQLATTQKKLAGEAREVSRAESRDAALSNIQEIAARVWQRQSDDPASLPPKVVLARGRNDDGPIFDSYVYPREQILEPAPRTAGIRQRRRASVLEEKLKSIGQVLAGFGLLDGLSHGQQEDLLQAIYQILSAPDE